MHVYAMIGKRKISTLKRYALEKENIKVYPMDTCDELQNMEVAGVVCEDLDLALQLAKRYRIVSFREIDGRLEAIIHDYRVPGTGTFYQNKHNRK